MAKKGKADKLRARLPRGFVDREAGEIRSTERMLQQIREIFERYGFDPVETPLVEYTDTLGKFLPDQDRPNEGVFSVLDDDDQWLSLRYDLTAPLARYVAANFDNLPKPYRSYRAGWVFRNEKPGPGRFRQFMQFDADTVGAPSVAADAEMCMLAADCLEELGIPRGQYVIRVNNRKVLDGVMEAIGLAGDEHAGTRLTVLRAVDKLDRLGLDGVRDLLGAGRKDESGDFTKGAGLGEEQIQKVLDVVGGEAEAWVSYKDCASLSTDDEMVKYGRDLFPDRTDWRAYWETEYVPDQDALIRIWLNAVNGSKVGVEGLTELHDMLALFRAAGYGSNRIQISSTVVRGLEYYTGPVYEAELTFEVTNDKGQVVQFGSVAGGGRYDGLVGRFRGQDVPATGFSIGISRLLAALRATGRMPAADTRGPVVVTVMDRDAIADYQTMVAELRAAKIRAELYLGNPKQFGKQLQYADRRDSPCVVIQGSDERDNGVVQIKDLVEGKRLAEAIGDNAAWRAARPAQITVPRGDLVAAVKRIVDAEDAEAGS